MVYYIVANFFIHCNMFVSYNERGAVACRWKNRRLMELQRTRLN